MSADGVAAQWSHMLPVMANVARRGQCYREGTPAHDQSLTMFACRICVPIIGLNKRRFAIVVLIIRCKGPRLGSQAECKRPSLDAAAD
jgi:hypothetical protein